MLARRPSVKRVSSFYDDTWQVKLPRQNNFADPAAQIMRAFTQVRERERAARNDAWASAMTVQARAQRERKHGACPNCGLVGRAVADGDGAGMTCECGACFGVTMREASFEWRQRGEVPDAHGAAAPAAAVLCSAAARQRLHERDVAGTSVPPALRAANEKMVRQLSRDEAHIRSGMDAAHRGRMEGAQKHVCTLFEAAGLDPDTNKICQQTYSDVEALYYRGCRHATHCQHDSGRECVAWMTRCTTKPKTVALACVHGAVDAAQKCADDGEAFHGLDARSVSNMTRALRSHMHAYLESTSAEEARVAAGRLMTAARLDVECAWTTGEDVMLTNDDAAPSPADGDGDGDGMAAWVAAVTRSITAMAELVPLRDRARDAIVQHAASPACYLWMEDSNGLFAADLVAAMLVTHYADSSKANASRKKMMQLARTLQVKVEQLDKHARALPPAP